MVFTGERAFPEFSTLDAAKSPTLLIRKDPASARIELKLKPFSAFLLQV